MTGGYLHQETGTKLRGSYGTGFRAPTINQLFFPDFGNPDLKPEKSKGLDVAVDQTLFNDRVALSAGYFWTRYQNLILAVFDPVGCNFTLFGFCAQNIGQSRAEGVEGEREVQTRSRSAVDQELGSAGSIHVHEHEQFNKGQDTRLPKWPLNQWSAILSYQPIEAVEGQFGGPICWATI